jgi:hypothetical protein
MLKISTYAMGVTSMGLQIGALVTTRWLVSDPYETNLFNVYTKNPDPKKDSKISDSIIKKIENEEDRSAYNAISGLAICSIVLIAFGMALLRLGFIMFSGIVFALSTLCAFGVIALLTSLRSKIFGEDASVKLGYSWYMYLCSAIGLLVTAIMTFSVKDDDTPESSNSAQPTYSNRYPQFTAPPIVYQSPPVGPSPTSQVPTSQVPTSQVPTSQVPTSQVPVMQTPGYYPTTRYTQPGYYQQRTGYY